MPDKETWTRCPFAWISNMRAQGFNPYKQCSEYVETHGDRHIDGASFVAVGAEPFIQTWDPTEDFRPLARVIWEASRRDEGSISAMGADHVAKEIISEVRAGALTIPMSPTPSSHRPIPDYDGLVEDLPSGIRVFTGMSQPKEHQKGDVWRQADPGRIWQIPEPTTTWEQEREAMVKALLCMMNEPQLTQGGNTGMTLSNFVRRVARKHDIDLAAEQLKALGHG